MISFTETTPSPEVELQLGLTSRERIFEIIRVRFADDIPIMLEGSHVPVRICPKLTKQDVEGSLYETITQASGSAPAEAHEVHKAVVLDAEQAGRRILEESCEELANHASGRIQSSSAGHCD